jgi:UDP-3-O-[3-hydroxymyristoyl] glucosamine N-acyltransferase
MQFTVGQIAQILAGEVKGDDSILIHDFCKIEEGKPGGLSFFSNPKYESYLYNTTASVVIVNKDFIPKQEILTNLILVKDAYLAMAELMRLYEKTQNASIGFDHKTDPISNSKIATKASVDGLAKIGRNTVIYPNTFIDSGVEIGDDCIIYSGVSILKNTKIGNKCVLHPGAVIGSDGFGFAPTESNEYQAIPQLGNVIIGNDCSIGTNTTIDRATMGSTILGNGVKLDNLVQIAHNVSIGDHTVMAAQSGVAGSSKVGKYCIVGGQTAISGHLTVADYSKIGGQSAVTKSITQEGESWAGRPLMKVRDFLKYLVKIKEFSK